MKHTLITLLVFLITEIAFSQPSIFPGDKSLRYDLLKSSSHTYKFITADSTGKVISVTTIEDGVIIDAKKKILVHTQNREMGPGRVLIDSTFADLATLAPIKMNMKTTPHYMSMNLKFEKDKVIAQADVRGKKTDTTHEMKAPYFDSNLFDFLIGLLPYNKDFTATVNVYIFERGGLEKYNIQYVGEDVMVASAVPTICYVVDVKPEVARAEKGQGYRYWVDKKTGVVVKLLVVMPKRGYFTRLLEPYYQKN